MSVLTARIVFVAKCAVVAVAGDDDGEVRLPASGRVLDDPIARLHSIEGQIKLAQVAADSAAPLRVVLIVKDADRPFVETGQVER